MSVLRAMIDVNTKMSRAIDRLLPARLRIDGRSAFVASILPRAIAPGTTIYDLGGGSQPCVTLTEKQRLGLRIVGLDISADELANAPEGIYDRAIAADLCVFKGTGDADAVVCQSTLEHVPDMAGAMRGLASCVKPGGKIFLFAPNRNALFARLNLVLPERMKRALLFAFFPSKAEGHDGFKAYYDHCTPREVAELARANGLVVEERYLYWTSSYFTIFAPAFVAWRLVQGAMYLALRENAAETFAFVLRRPSGDEDVMRPAQATFAAT